MASSLSFLARIEAGLLDMYGVDIVLLTYSSRPIARVEHCFREREYALRRHSCLHIIKRL